MSARSLLCLPCLLAALGAGGCALSATAPAGSREVPAGAQPSPRTCHARGRGLFVLPDPRCTPGASDPRVTQANIHATICRYGYTRSVRPPESVTEPEKLASMAAYGDSGSPRHYEYDHLIPLELGGAPNDPRNLWPEPGATPNPKDRLERRLNRAVCAGELALRTAQSEIARDWIATATRWRRTPRSRSPASPGRAAR
jgi:hypothetical protein